MSITDHVVKIMDRKTESEGANVMHAEHSLPMQLSFILSSFSFLNLICLHTSATA